MTLPTSIIKFGCNATIFSGESVLPFPAIFPKVGRACRAAEKSFPRFSILNPANPSNLFGVLESNNTSAGLPALKTFSILAGGGNSPAK